MSEQRHASPFELDLTLQVLEQDEVLQQNVPPEVAVAELEVHQLEMKRKEEGVRSCILIHMKYIN